MIWGHGVADDHITKVAPFEMTIHEQDISTDRLAM